MYKYKSENNDFTSQSNHICAYWCRFFLLEFLVSSRQSRFGRNSTAVGQGVYISFVSCGWRCEILDFRAPQESQHGGFTTGNAYHTFVGDSVLVQEGRREREREIKRRFRTLWYLPRSCLFNWIFIAPFFHVCFCLLSKVEVVNSGNFSGWFAINCGQTEISPQDFCVRDFWRLQLLLLFPRDQRTSLFLSSEKLYKWGSNPYKWPYRWQTGVCFTLLLWVISPHV